MTPLEITATLSSPIAGWTDLPFDGLLSAAWMRRERPDLYWNSQVPADILDVVEAELPLERRGEGALWYWAASFAVWPADARADRSYWNKRFDQKETHHLAEAVNRLNVASDKYKAYHMPVPTKSAFSLRWWAVGDLVEIRRLLDTIPAIGKKRSQGWGIVTSWEMREVENDYSCFRDGRPTRTIPFSIDEISTRLPPQGSNIGPRSYRPPYWHPGRIALCLIPDQETLTI